MKHFMAMTFVLFFCAGCMWVSEEYVPANSGGGYEFSGSCIGYNWEECQARAEALCAEVGQRVVSIENKGGPENKIVPKRITVQCGGK